MKSICIQPGGVLGTLEMPPSKSLSHRAVIAAGLAKGTSVLHNIVMSEDIAATCAGMKAMGVQVEQENHSLVVTGWGGLTAAVGDIDCRESGSTLRFLIPLGLLTGKETTFTGKGRLAQRPLTPYYRIFDAQGIRYSSAEGLPLTIEGRLKPGKFILEGNISSQFLTGLMFVLPLLEEDSWITLSTPLESRGYIDLTRDILETFGVVIECQEDGIFYIQGKQQYRPCTYTNEGDFSQAAFWISAGVLQGDVTCQGLQAQSLQADRAILDVVARMGGQVEVGDNQVRTRSSTLHGITVDVSECPDIMPIISVLGCFAQGTTRIVNAARLRIKESDRLHAMAVELGKLGASIEEHEDSMVIYGKPWLEGGEVDSWNDHRIAMALSIAALRCKQPVTIHNSGAVAKSYGNFFEDFIKVGGRCHERCVG